MGSHLELPPASDLPVSEADPVTEMEAQQPRGMICPKVIGMGSMTSSLKWGWRLARQRRHEAGSKGKGGRGVGYSLRHKIKEGTIQLHN